MGLKQISTLEIEIYESMNNLDPSIVKEIIANLAPRATI